MSVCMCVCVCVCDQEWVMSELSRWDEGVGDESEEQLK